MRAENLLCLKSLRKTWLILIMSEVINGNGGRISNNFIERQAGLELFFILLTNKKIFLSLIINDKLSKFEEFFFHFFSDNIQLVF